MRVHTPVHVYTIMNHVHIYKITRWVYTNVVAMLKFDAKNEELTKALNSTT